MQKRQSSHQCLSALLGSARTKASCKMLVKSTPSFDSTSRLTFTSPRQSLLSDYICFNNLMTFQGKKKNLFHPSDIYLFLTLNIFFSSVEKNENIVHPRYLLAFLYDTEAIFFLLLDLLRRFVVLYKIVMIEQKF